MSHYVIRTEDGIMIAKVGNDLAFKIISKAAGQFIPYRVAGKPVVTAFEISEDTVFGVPGFELCLWKKTKLIPA